MKLSRMVLILSLLCSGSFALQGQDLNTTMDSISYALGMNLGRSISQLEGIDLNREMIYQGLEDMFGDKEAALTQQDVQSLLMALQQEMQAAQMEQARAAASEAKERGQAFLEENKTKEGVEVTESGLQYKVITSASGPTPAATSVVKVHYEGRLLDGTVFDSSYERGQPAEFPLNRVISGWTEGLQLMPVGSKFQFYIPSGLAYGDRGSPPAIGPGETLVFDVELLEIVSQ